MKWAHEFMLVSFFLKWDLFMKTKLICKYTVNSLLNLPMYIAHSNTFLPTTNHVYFIILWQSYEGGKHWKRKYHKFKPLQLVTTNVSLFEKELLNKEFLSWVICGLVQSFLGTEWCFSVLRNLFYLAFILNSWNWVMLLSS